MSATASAPRGLDHLVIGVRDLDAAGKLYERLGFRVGARLAPARFWPKIILPVPSRFAGPTLTRILPSSVLQELDKGSGWIDTA